MEEIWKRLENYPNYSVSSEGRVRNDLRERIVKTSVNAQGLCKVGLMVDGKQRTRSVSLLVASEFVHGRSDIYDTPIHLDGSKLNNHVDNLMWRPRWFTYFYSEQFNHLELYQGKGPIVERKTGVVYTDIVEAGVVNGLLFRDIRAALVNKTPVIPTYAMFDWVGEED